MKLEIFVLYDRQSEEYKQPFFVNSHVQAIRGILQLKTDEQSELKLFPEQFDLEQLGSFDTENGSLFWYAEEQKWTMNVADLTTVEQGSPIEKERKENE
jgi:hypothetical protein